MCKLVHFDKLRRTLYSNSVPFWPLVFLDDIPPLLVKIELLKLNVNINKKRDGKIFWGKALSMEQVPSTISLCWVLGAEDALLPKSIGLEGSEKIPKGLVRPFIDSF